MEITEKYANLKERTEKLNLRESQNLRMLHDDFDPDWKSGDEPHGTMTFTDIMPPTVIPEPIRDLAVELDDLKARIEKLETI